MYCGNFLFNLDATNIKMKNIVIMEYICGNVVRTYTCFMCLCVCVCGVRV